MTSRADFIRAARARLGQPYLASGAQDRGANCLGLWACVLGPKQLAEGMTRYLAKVPIAAAQPGDLLVFRDENGSERHLGLLTEPGVVLHADNRRGRVVEHRLPIPRMRAVAAFRLPGLAD
jgi:cell wall-associated NlpC family hydrolase